MSRIKQVLISMIGFTIVGSAYARHPEDFYYDYARVVRVDPIIETTDRPISREVCHDEPVEYYQPGYTYHRDRTGPTIAGAIIGGALGNLVGKGDGRKAATVAGAVIGGSIAHEHARGGYYSSDGHYQQGYERHCRSETDYRDEDQVVGYDVTYRYEDHTYHERMDYDPGSRVRVEVSDGDARIAE